MSGPLEAIGIAASIIQVAELGTKLSVKLFSFYRELKGANKFIQDLSSDVAITSAILHELGESLKEDEQAKLYSKQAFGCMQDVLNQCEEVLQQIRDMTKYSDSSEKTRLQQITEMFRQVVLEPKVDPLKASLKRLKATMFLLLNVIMYAGQLRSNHAPKMLQEQRDFIKTLLEEKQRLDATNAVTSSPVTILASVNPGVAWGNGDSKSGKPSDLDEYILLMQRMIQEINSCKSRLGQSRHSRIKSGVLNIHSREILQFQLHHGQSILQHFDQSLFAEELPDDSSQTIPEAGSLEPSNLEMIPTCDTKENEEDLPRECSEAGSLEPPRLEMILTCDTQENEDSSQEIYTSSRENMHNQDRLFFCPVPVDCPRRPGGRGFKCKSCMLRHASKHKLPEYVCPFCPDGRRIYQRADTLSRHVRVRHPDKSSDDPILREVIAREQIKSATGGPRMKPETSNIDQPDSRRCSSVGGSALTDQIIEDDICGNPWESDKAQSFETLLLQWTTLRRDEIPA